MREKPENEPQKIPFQFQHFGWVPEGYMHALMIGNSIFIIAKYDQVIVNLLRPAKCFD